jgi:hypothetical protein
LAFTIDNPCHKEKGGLGRRPQGEGNFKVFNPLWATVGGTLTCSPHMSQHINQIVYGHSMAVGTGAGRYTGGLVQSLAFGGSDNKGREYSHYASHQVGRLSCCAIAVTIGLAYLSNANTPSHILPLLPDPSLTYSPNLPTTQPPNLPLSCA